MCMSAPKNSDAVLMGIILGAHGIKGDVMIKSFAENPADIAAYGPLLSADTTRQFDLKIVRETHKGLTVHITGFDDRTAVEALKGTELYLPRARLPDPDSNAFYHADLIGLRAIDVTGATLGTIKAVQNYGASDILEIARTDGSKEELIPFTHACVPEVSLQAGTVTIITPVVSEVKADDVDIDSEASAAPGSDKF